jgi:hypothetical protein
MKHRIAQLVSIFAFLIVGTFVLPIGITHVVAHPGARPIPHCAGEQCNGQPVDAGCSADAAIIDYTTITNSSVIAVMTILQSKACNIYYAQLRSVGGTRLMSLSILRGPLSYESGSQYIKLITSPMVAVGTGTVIVTGIAHANGSDHPVILSFPEK